ncbi:Ig-like domain-containing protein [Verminephrobacter aporrectodeae]|uniref:Ig-like domain-containing protein n=1 Tax=Verminephrobacter aporrectodeae TaxID=1110389 RepID=UPI002243D4E6|nr:Ig-like domain-containing protein [Verminephrobacter aporrectodeae]
MTFRDVLYDIDLVRPTATITLADNALTVGETTTVTFAFSEPVTGFTREDIVLTDANGTLGPLTANADGKTWTATFTPTANVNDTTNTIRVNLTGVNDIAGNAGVGTASSSNYTVSTRSANTADPTVTITLADTSLTVGDTTTVTFAFNEAVRGFTNDDVVLTDANGTLGTLTANADGKTWTATFTPTNNIEDSSNTIGVNLAGVTDAAGTAGTGSASSANYSIDTKRPVVNSITIADTKLCAGESTTVTITFSEALKQNSFTLNTLSSSALNGGTFSDLRTTDDITWQLTLTAPTSGTSSTGNYIRLRWHHLIDLAGNRGLNGDIDLSEAPYDIDLVRPTATITLTDNALTVGETTTVTFAFSEPVTGFTHDDIVLTDANGTLGPLTANADGKTWTATFTPTANVNDATNTIRVNLTGVNDIAGNAGQGSASSGNYTVQTQRLTATITLADTSLIAGETTTVTIVFNETVTGFTREDIVLTDANGTLSNPTTPDNGKTWIATFTPTANVEDNSNTIGVNLAGVTDAAGTAGTGSASSANYSIDTKRPTPTNLTIEDPKLCAGESTTVTLTFSEALNQDSFTLARIRSAATAAANPGTLSDLRTTNGMTWQFTLTAPTTGASSTGNYLCVNMTSTVTDVAGNGSRTETTYFDVPLYDIDLVRPTATITLADTALTVGETTTVTFVFSETVTDFTRDDIVLTNANGTLGPLTAHADGKTWTAIFTPTASLSDTTNTISVNLADVADTAGNAGVGTASSANYTVDTLRPTATITLADTRLIAGETTTVSIVFNETVTGFTRADIVLTDANGTLGDPTTHDNGKTWTATFTPTADVEDSSNTIGVNQAGVTDAAGNAGTGFATSANYSIDTKRPFPTSITIADPKLCAGESTTVTLTFSEALNRDSLTLEQLGFTRDLTANSGAGTLSDLRPTDSMTWQYTLTAPTTGASSTGNYLSVLTTAVTDAAGNTGQSGSTYFDNVLYDIDLVRPTVTITLADSALTADETTTVTFAFSETVTGFTRDDIVLANGTLGDLTTHDNGRTWTATLTPTANVHAAANTIRVNLSGVTDVAGNTGTATATSASYSIDTKRPTPINLTIEDPNLCAGESTTVTLTFSEALNRDDFTLNDLGFMSNASVGTLSDLRTTDGITWKFTLTAPTSGDSSTGHAISLNLRGITDVAGNTGQHVEMYFRDVLFDFDLVRPTATITLADSALTIGETTTATFAFSEPVTDFTREDIVLTDANGTLGPLTANADGKTWTATFTPAADVNDATNTISVNLGGVTDTAGNAGVSTASSANYTVDTLRPSATITLADTRLIAGETTTVTIVFNEPVTDFTRADIVLTDANGTLGDLTTNDHGKTWTATFTPTANVNNATNTLSVNLSGVTDTAGNAGAGTASSANYTVDTLRPSATITLADSALTIGETTTVTIVFNETVTGFTNDDVVLSDANGTLSPLTANADGKTWTATFTPTANVNDATNTLSVNLSGMTDTAGNAGVGSASSANYTVDTLRPTATITLADTSLIAGETTTVTIVFSEPVTGFTRDDIVLSDANGTLGTLTAHADGKTWTATFTPTANVNDTTNTISVNLTGVTDTAGNAGTGSASSANYTVDTLRPSATITLADTRLIAGETTTVTIVFNETVTGFTNDDIVLTDANGTLGPLTVNADGKTWTTTFTPTANVNDTTNTISVNLTGVTDTAGNAGTGSASSANYTVDTRPADTTGPTATITLADSALTVGETTPVTIRFSEPVTGFDASDVVLTNANGTLSPLTPTANRTVWTATFTPTANVNDTTNTISVNLAGLTDDAGNAGTATASSANYTVDTRPADTTGLTATITLADSALTVGKTTTVTIRFNKPVTSFANDDIVLTDANGTLSPLTPNANRTVWTATFTPTANVNDTTNTISVNLTGLTDDAGNAGVSSANYTVDTRPDTTPPVLSTAMVSNNQLVLTYTEANSLDATHIPPTTAFAVRIDNVLTAVTAITVNAQDKTVSLTLATAVSTGQTVTVAYNDPTTGDDANAIQDAAGNDAASVPATPVNNRTPAPQSPAPASSPNPAPSSASASAPAPSSAPSDKDSKDTKDTDGDGIPNSVEDQTPGIPGPAGAAPIAGDGNGDGVKDSTQATVSSTSLVRSPTGESRPAGAASTHVTLVADSLDGKPNPGSSARITHLEQKNAPTELPKGMEMPLGLLRFEAAQATGHGSEKFSLYVDPVLGVNGYWLPDSTGTWVNLASSPYGGKMAMEGGQLRLDFEISDGGQFDADGKANGVITAPGAAAKMPLSIVGQAPDLAHGGFWI